MKTKEEVLKDLRIGAAGGNAHCTCRREDIVLALGSVPAEVNASPELRANSEFVLCHRDRLHRVVSDALARIEEEDFEQPRSDGNESAAITMLVDGKAIPLNSGNPEAEAALDKYLGPGTVVA